MKLGAGRHAQPAHRTPAGIAPGAGECGQAGDGANRVAAARMATRMLKPGAMPDRYERQDAAFHERVRAGFAAIVAADPDRCRLIDAGGTQAETHVLVLAALGL